MSYATQADIEKLIPEDELILLTDDESLGIVDIQRVADALETASITIDSYIGGPVDPAPAILGVMEAKIAGYLLHIRKDRVSDIWEKENDKAIRFLEKVASGDWSLSATSTAPSSTTESLQVIANDTLFPASELDKF